VLIVISTTTLNSFEENYQGPIIGPEIAFERSLKFVQMQNMPKVLDFHF
jgi:hypothetical protein